MLPWLIVLAALGGLATWAAMRERGIDLGGTAEPEPPATPVPEAATLVS